MAFHTYMFPETDIFSIIVSNKGGLIILIFLEC